MTTQVLENVPLQSYLDDARLSTHLMSKFADQGPRMFIMASAKMLAPKESSEEQKIGQLFEDIVQGREPDLSKYAAKPAGMSFATKEGKAWRADKLGAGLEIIAQEDLDGMRWMHESFLENEAAMDLVRRSKKQVTMYMEKGPTMWGLKSRPDYLVFDGSTPLPGGVSSAMPVVSVDLKTCSNLNVLSSGKQVREYRYYCQAALVHRLARDAGASSGFESYLLGVEKQQPFRCQLLRVPEAWLDAGDRWIDHTIAQIEACARAENWPRVLDECRDIAPPPSWL